MAKLVYSRTLETPTTARTRIEGLERTYGVKR
jgi:hypothetical protein